MMIRIFIIFLSLASTSLHAENVGETLYIQNCAVCHASDGSGAMPGIPDLVGSLIWTTKSETELLSVVKQGINKPGAVMTMPPKGGNEKLSDNELMEIITHMRASFAK